MDLFSFMLIWMCVTASIRITGVCTHVCVGPYPNKWRQLGRRAWSTPCPLIAIYILAESLISNSPIICHPIPSPSPLFDVCVNVRACRRQRKISHAVAVFFFFFKDYCKVAVEFILSCVLCQIFLSDAK